MNVTDTINIFKRKYSQGFTNAELDEILKLFPNINKKKFYETLHGNTCMVIDNLVINYSWDVELALNCGIEGRDQTEAEWD